MFGSGIDDVNACMLFWRAVLLLLRPERPEVIVRVAVAVSFVYSGGVGHWTQRRCLHQPRSSQQSNGDEDALIFACDYV